MAVLRFFSRAKSIYECNGFLCRMQFLLCGSALWWPTGTDKCFVVHAWTRLYSLGVSAALLYSLSYTVYAKFVDPEQRELISHLDNLLLSIVCLELCAAACASVICVCSMQRQARRHLRLYAQLQEIDRRLNVDFGADLEYGKLRRKNFLLASISFCAYSAAVCATCLQMTHGDWPRMLVGAFCYAAMTGGTHASGYAHINLAEMLRIRFRLLQRLLAPAYLRWRFPHSSERLQRLQSAVEMVKQLHELVAEINGVYMMTVLAALTHDFTLSTSELYIIFGSSIGTGTSLRLLGNVCMCLFAPLYKMLAAPIYCNMAINEGKKCLRIIEQADTWFQRNEVVTRIVASTMQWRLAHKIEFNAGLNIVVNKTLVTIITVVIFNYLLILVQFRMTQEMGEHIEQQKNSMQDWIGATA